MSKRIDLTGQRFGRLIVIEKTQKDGKAMWRCQCECGKETVVLGNSLLRGATRSCGCLWLERTREINTVLKTRHGARHTRLYYVWIEMKQRCSNPNNKRYVDYGGRGIRVCEEWKDFAVFQKWALENGYQEGLSIDRINNDENYEPQNCRWANRKTQCRNQRKNHLIIYKGQTKTLTEWAEQFCINKHTLRMRLKLGWSVEEALETPVKNFNKM